MKNEACNYSRSLSGIAEPFLNSKATTSPASGVTPCYYKRRQDDPRQRERVHRQRQCRAEPSEAPPLRKEKGSRRWCRVTPIISSHCNDRPAQTAHDELTRQSSATTFDGWTPRALHRHLQWRSQAFCACAVWLGSGSPCRGRVDPLALTANVSAGPDISGA